MKPPISRVLLAGLALALLTLGAYRHAGSFGFVNLDDDAYVEFAPMVNQGVRRPALVWAFTSVHTANWHPFTTLSHMVDCEFFGVRAAPMHWENVGWHVLNSILVFLVWRALTGALWRSALVAALFALHPLHVESVAWISSRKDLLCTFFWLLGIGAYLRWVRAPSLGRYGVVALCLAAALLFKPMAVTFPATLLLLDGWPLGRWNAARWPELLREKIPLFAIVVVHSIVTFVVQYQAGAATYAERIPFAARLGNAVFSYVRYLGKTFWPEGLSPLYWHPGYWPWAAGAGSAVLLGVLSFVVWRRRIAYPWLFFGWLWFLGTLVPVIGIVQVGAQAMADRYTYVPLLGVFTIVGWFGGEIVARLPRLRIPVAAGAIAAIAGCFFLTQQQAAAWKNSITLYERSIAAGEENAAIRYLLATALIATGRPESEIVTQFNRALALQPDYVNAITQLAIIAINHQRFDEALALVEKTIRLEPRNAALRVNLGGYWLMRGDQPRAIEQFQAGLKLTPNAAGIHRELAQVYARQNRFAEARTHYEAALKNDPWHVLDWANLGFLLGNRGYLADARRCFERALWIDPKHEFSRRNLAAIAEMEKPKKS